MQQGSKVGAKAEPRGGLGKIVTLIFATAAGLSVANIYYAQPLLGSLAEDFGMTTASVGIVVTLTQVGYGLGLIFLVPLGDLVSPRRLILTQGALSVVALIGVATARTEAILLASLAAMGLLAVVVQVLVALAATLATPDQRGKAVGTVTSGIVIGILGARFVAGVLADVGGWRAVYLTSALMTAVMVAVLVRVLPRQGAQPKSESYMAVLRSIPILFLRDRVLLVRGALAFLIFAAFSTFWTALVLPLSVGPFFYSHTQVGLFGLVGVVAALAATLAGRLADRGLGQGVTGIALALLLASWAPIAFLSTSIPLLLVGVIVLDLAVQAVHVTNQSIILERHPEARSRLIGGYMVFYSFGSAIGAAATTLAYATAAWQGVVMLGAGFSGVALVVWARTRHWS